MEFMKSGNKGDGHGVSFIEMLYIIIINAQYAPCMSKYREYVLHPIHKSFPRIWSFCHDFCTLGW